MPQFDAIVIGTGQAGPSLVRRLAAAGRTVAVIERKDFGGTCVNTGCTPSKTLIASAGVAHLVARAHEYGVSIGAHPSACTETIRGRRCGATHPIASSSSNAFHMPTMPVPPPVGYRIQSGYRHSSCSANS